MATALLLENVRATMVSSIRRIMDVRPFACRIVLTDIAANRGDVTASQDSGGLQMSTHASPIAERTVVYTVTAQLQAFANASLDISKAKKTTRGAS